MIKMINLIDTMPLQLLNHFKKTSIVVVVTDINKNATLFEMFEVDIFTDTLRFFMYQWK